MKYELRQRLTLPLVFSSSKLQKMELISLNASVHVLPQHDSG